jgi:hypothetical protein
VVPTISQQDADRLAGRAAIETVELDAEGAVVRAAAHRS